LTKSKTLIEIGLDIGGTKTSGISQVRSGGSTIELEQIDSTGLNLKSAGIDAVLELIVDIVASSRSAHWKIAGNRSAIVVVCAGIAGAGSEHDRHILSGRFQEKFPQDVLITHTDIFIALEGAFSGESGMICITGTGSNVCARDRAGRSVSTGGWGRLIGDPASGWQIGKDSLRFLSERLDEAHRDILEPTARDFMLSALSHDFDLTSREKLTHFVYDSQTSPSVLATSVVTAAKSGDAAAQTIIAKGIRSFVDQIVRLSKKVTDIEKRFVHLGGLAKSDYFSGVFLQEMRRQLPDWNVAIARESPIQSALRLAESHFAAL